MCIAQWLCCCLYVIASSRTFCDSGYVCTILYDMIVSPMLNNCTSVVTVFCASSVSQARRFATDIHFGLIVNDGTTE